MPKRIVVCADGTWNRPEEDHEYDTSTNVLRVARAIKPFDGDDSPQHVFYDWGIGSYNAPVTGGVTGRGIHKNIQDGYRYIVQNYTPGAEIYLFGFSRGAYTVRCLCGLINNIGILKRPNAALIAEAFRHYKNEGKKYHPDGEASVEFRERHSHRSRRVHFVGAWDTVGALGIPLSLLGLFDRTDEFYDTKLGPNVDIARHALAIDEQRSDFEPTVSPCAYATFKRDLAQRHAGDREAYTEGKEAFVRSVLAYLPTSSMPIGSATDNDVSLRSTAIGREKISRNNRSASYTPASRSGW